MPVPADRGVHRRSLLRDDVYRSLRDAIVRGELAPGEKLRDLELSTWLGVSRTPIREALLRLGRAGLVVSTPGRLTMVAPENPQRLGWAQQVVAELHAFAVRIGSFSADDLTQMAQANSRLRLALVAGDAEAAIGADEEFHAVAVKACGNPLIGEQLESLTLMLRRAEYLHFGTMTDSASPGQHDEIIAALQAGDKDLAAELTRQNWQTII